MSCVSCNILGWAGKLRRPRLTTDGRGSTREPGMREGAASLLKRESMPEPPERRGGPECSGRRRPVPALLQGCGSTRCASRARKQSRRANEVGAESVECWWQRCLLIYVRLRSPPSKM